MIVKLSVFTGDIFDKMFNVRFLHQKFKEYLSFCCEDLFGLWCENVLFNLSTVNGINDLTSDIRLTSRVIFQTLFFPRLKSFSVYEVMINDSSR